MQNLGSLEVPIPTITPLERGSNKKLTFTTYINAENDELFTELTGSTILFELRLDKKTNTILQKATTNLAGGSTDQIDITSSSIFSLYLTEADTKNLQDVVYWGLFTINKDFKTYKKYVQIPFI